MRRPADTTKLKSRYMLLACIREGNRNNKLGRVTKIAHPLKIMNETRPQQQCHFRLCVCRQKGKGDFSLFFPFLFTLFRRSIHLIPPFPALPFAPPLDPDTPQTRSLPHQNETKKVTLKYKIAGKVMGLNYVYIVPVFFEKCIFLKKDTFLFSPALWGSLKAPPSSLYGRGAMV